MDIHLDLLNAVALHIIGGPVEVEIRHKDRQYARGRLADSGKWTRGIMRKTTEGAYVITLQERDDPMLFLRTFLHECAHCSWQGASLKSTDLSTEEVMAAMTDVENPNVNSATLSEAYRQEYEADGLRDVWFEYAQAHVRADLRSDLYTNLLALLDMPRDPPYVEDDEY
jgi:hypothetical protein